MRRSDLMNGQLEDLKEGKGFHAVYQEGLDYLYRDFLIGELVFLDICFQIDIATLHEAIIHFDALLFLLDLLFLLLISLFLLSTLLLLLVFIDTFDLDIPTPNLSKCILINLQKLQPSQNKGNRLFFIKTSLVKAFYQLRSINNILAEVFEDIQISVCLVDHLIKTIFLVLLNLGLIPKSL